MILGFAAVAPIALVALWQSAPLVGIGLLVLSHALILYPTLRPNVQWLGPVFTRFATEKREIWLTVDDGPTEDTPSVLNLFDTHGVRATFFVKGALAAAHPDLITAMLARGHSVANHTQTHPAFTFWCALPRRVASEIDGCNKVLLASGVSETRWFRAPVGMKNPAIHPALGHRNMRLIGWTMRGFDGVMSDPERVLRHILPKLRPGAIIVLHQGQESSLRVLERVIVEARERGYSFVIPEDSALRTK